MNTERLVSLGFTEEYNGRWEALLPGTFRFRVTAHTEDEDGEPLPEPEWSVSLPHQCDAWEVAIGVSAQAARWALMAFVREAEAAHDLLVRAST